MDEQDQLVRFVIEASRREKMMAALCREYGVSRPTGYEWRRRYEQGGIGAVQEHSHRPVHSPERTGEETEQRVVALRRQRSGWGGVRKLQRLLEREEREISRSTVHRVLLWHGLVREADRRPAPQRFEQDAPNELWQMDLKSPKGWKLPVCDDHNRYVITLAATGTTRGEAVRAQLEEAFDRCGVPHEMLMDHGCPWWNGQAPGGAGRRCGCG